MKPIYAPPDPASHPQQPHMQKRSQPLILAAIERFVAWIVGSVAFVAALVAILQYLGILPPAFLPVVHWVEQTVQHLFHP